NVGSQYDRLVDYAGELRKTNPGTTVHLSIDPFADGVCQGELLAAIGRDGNNQIYPIAWAVVQVESTETWEWFVKLLTKDLGLAVGHGITFISDGHKRLIQAVRRVVPRVEHRKWSLSPSGRHQFEVRQGNGIEAFCVDLEKRECSCRQPPRSMTCKNYGETGHNKNDCEKPKVPDEQANPPNEQANPPSQQANPLKKKGRPMVNDPVNARVPSQSMDKFVTARGGIWMGGTSASGSNRGRGSAKGSNRGRGSASGSNSGKGSASGSNRGRGSGASGSNKVVVTKPVVERYILLDEDDLVDIQVEEEVDTRYENVASEAAEQDEKKDEAARLKKRTRHIL
ncbi:kinase-like domain-containing protein, partial [Tanacetum coccineum]